MPAPKLPTLSKQIKTKEEATAGNDSVTANTTSSGIPYSSSDAKDVQMDDVCEKLLDANKNDDGQVDLKNETPEKNKHPKDNSSKKSESSDKSTKRKEKSDRQTMVTEPISDDDSD